MTCPPHINPVLKYPYNINTVDYKYVLCTKHSMLKITSQWMEMTEKLYWPNPICK